MKIAIDMQPCQTDSRYRGIGRYVLELVRAMTQSKQGTDVTLLVDACHVERMREARRQFRCEGLDARVLSFHYPAQDANIVVSRAAELSQAAGLLRSRVLQSLQPDAVLVTSFFEGYDGGYGADSDLDMQVLAGIPKAVIAYDLIPLLFPERYLPEGSPYTAWYQRKLEKFKQFDLYLAISEATREDLIRLLGIDPERIQVIGAGFRHREPMVSAEAEEVDLAKLGIRSPFVLMVGNGDWRKNNLAALACFAALPKALRESHQLILTQAGDDVQKALLGECAGIADRTLVLGQVDDAVLSKLYSECAVFFFPSRYEGFGLPVLEAMAHGAAVVSSNAGALGEVMFDREALFDPEDIEAGSRLLARTLTDDLFRTRLAKIGPSHAAGFTWERSAQLALDALSVVSRQREAANPAHAASMLDQNEGESTQVALPSDAWQPSDAEIGLLAASLCTMGRSAQPRIESALAAVLKGRRRRILVDVSCVAVTNTWTGIQRVVRNYCIGLAALAARNPEFDVHLISYTEDGLRYANEFGIERLGLDLEPISGAVQVLPDDVLFLLDSTWEWPERFDPLIEAVWQKGGEVVRMVYDLVPILFPQTCHPGMPPVFRHWMEHAVARTDGVICISEAVRQDLEDFMDGMEARHALPFRPWTRVVHLGSDLESGRASETSELVRSLLNAASGHSLLLAVGTVEPRKDHGTILSAFDELWNQGAEPILVVVGKQGWNVEAVAERMREHPLSGKCLFWLEHANDGDLDAIMRRADALIQASVSEGFGLPIVEAGSKGVPLVLSDIPVFREIAGEEAVYFPAGNSHALAKLIEEGMARGGWLHPKGIRTLTWEQSSIELVDQLLTPAALRGSAEA